MEVQGYPNYVIYEDGRVWSKGYKNASPKFLTNNLDSMGYYSLTLRHPKKKFYIHRLVAIHYIPNPLNKEQVDHKDGNKLNNDISNLRWVDNRENSNMFKSCRNDNTSGHIGISFYKRTGRWEYHKKFYDTTYRKVSFKSKTDALCYKFIILLKIRVSTGVHV